MKAKRERRQRQLARLRMRGLAIPHSRIVNHQTVEKLDAIIAQAIKEQPEKRAEHEAMRPAMLGPGRYLVGWELIGLVSAGIERANQQARTAQRKAEADAMLARMLGART